MSEGVVKWFNEKKNFGFIEFPGLEDIFFHGTSIADHGFFGLAKDDRVTFEVRETQRGRQAFNVKDALTHPPPSDPPDPLPQTAIGRDAT